ncbi:MAG: chorismate mutase [Acidimicrobiia bacterium]
MRLVAIRGAITVDKDDPQEIVDKTAFLLQKILELNEVGSDDLVSIIFTATEDLRSEFPAAGARAIGLLDVPLLGAREILVEHGPPRCIRVLVHCYSSKSRSEIKHVYEGEAKRLRVDLAN